MGSVLARTQVYPLEMGPSRSPARFLLEALARGWCRHGLALATTLVLLAGAAVVDVLTGGSGHLGCLYLLPVALGSFVLPMPLPLGVAALSFLVEAMVRWSGVADRQPAVSPTWLEQVAFALSLALVTGAVAALRRAVLRDARRARVLEGLRVVSSTVLSTLDLQQVLQTALAQAQRLTRADPVAVWLVDREQETLSLAAALATSPKHRVRADANRIRLDSEHTLSQCIHRRAILVADLLRPGDGSGGERQYITGAPVAAVVPLVARGAPVGALVAGLRKRPGADALQVLQELANNAARAIDNARLYSQAQRHVAALERLRADAERAERRATFLAEAGRQFSARLDVCATMETVVSQAAEMLGDACLLVMLQPDRDAVRVAASREPRTGAGSGLHQYFEANPPRYGVGPIGTVLKTGEPLLARHDAMPSAVPAEYVRKAGIRALVVAPLRLRDRTRGALVAAYCDPAHLPTQEDLTLAVLLADRAAAAIDNAELFEETQRAGIALEAWSRELEHRVAEKTRELEEAHRELLRAERLASIGQLAATVAHELRNPLNVIKVAHFALQQGCSAERRQRHLDAVGRQVAAASRIINDLVDFTREAPPQFEPVAIEPLIRLALANARVPAHITMEVQVEPDLPPVLADHAQIARALGSLIENAVQVMPAQGKLTLRAGREEDTLRVAVTDTGPGIAAEVVPHLFEPLFTTKTKGTGLGLSIARRVAEAHQGTILVDSTAGAGATFTLVLPLAQSVQGLPQQGEPDAHRVADLDRRPAGRPV